jgi:hypothetical protein
MLRILEQSTGAEIDVITNDEANLEIVLGMWAGDLGLPVHRLVLLEFEDPVQFPGTLVEQAGGDQ